MRTIHGYLGEPLMQLFQQNGGTGDLTNRYDNSPVIFPSDDASGELFQFTYGQPGDEIHLPVARLIWFTQYAGVVTEVLVNTSAQKGTLEATYAALHELRAGLLRARWQETKPLVSLDELKASIATAEGTSPSVGSATFHKGDAEAVITLNTPGAAITPAAGEQPAFVAQIWFHNETLEGVQSKKTYDARIKVRGNSGISLPLSYWVK